VAVGRANVGAHRAKGRSDAFHRATSQRCVAVERRVDATGDEPGEHPHRAA